MTTLGDYTLGVRSKNAGPFWLTIDVFCTDEDAYRDVCRYLKTDRIAALFGTEVEAIRRFEIESLNVVKFSLPRPVVQGSRFDRDQHGAQWSVLVAALELEDSARGVD